MRSDCKPVHEEIVDEDEKAMKMVNYASDGDAFDRKLPPSESEFLAPV